MDWRCGPSDRVLPNKLEPLSSNPTAAPKGVWGEAGDVARWYSGGLVGTGP
jgi:hypothetical protein